MRAWIFARSAWRSPRRRRERGRRAPRSAPAAKSARGGPRASPERLPGRVGDRRRRGSGAPRPSRPRSPESGRAERPGREEDAAHEVRIERAVIAGPDVAVVLEHRSPSARRARTARRRGSRAGSSTIRSGIRRGSNAPIDLLALEDARDRALPRSSDRSAPRASLHELVAERLVLGARRDDAAVLAALRG